MRKRRWWVAGGVVVLFAAGAALIWPRSARITRESFDQLHDRMRLADIEALVGAPPGDYTTAPTTEVGPPPIKTFEPPDGLSWNDSGGRQVAWYGDEGDLLVGYGTDGVRWASFAKVTKDNQSPLENAVWRIKRQWQRCFPGERKSTGYIRPPMPLF
jgi:hypothetical protein